MTYNDLIREYMTQRAVARACGRTQPAVANWKRRGYIPYLAQLDIQKKNPKLRAVDTR